LQGKSLEERALGEANDAPRGSLRRLLQHPFGSEARCPRRTSAAEKASIAGAQLGSYKKINIFLDKP
jgi:hypothetical protein